MIVNLNKNYYKIYFVCRNVHAMSVCVCTINPLKISVISQN